MSLIVMCCCCPSIGDELITPVYIPPTRPPWKQQPPASNEYDDEDDGEKYNQRLCSGKDGHRNCDFTQATTVSQGRRDRMLLSTTPFVQSVFNQLRCTTYVVGIRVRYLARQFEKYHGSSWSGAGTSKFHFT